jgi:hypothetical protein
MSPKQRVEVTVTLQPARKPSVEDRNGEFRKQYRPRTFGAAASFAIKDLSGDPKVLSMTLVDVPITVK